MCGLEGAAEDFFGGGPEHFVGDVAGACAAVAVVVNGVGGEESVLDGVGEDAAEQPEDAVHGGVFVAAGVHVAGPLLDVVAVDVAQGGVSVSEPDVFGDQVSVVLDCEFVDIECRPPPVSATRRVSGGPGSGRGTCVGNARRLRAVPSVHGLDQAAAILLDDETRTWGLPCGRLHQEPC